MRATHLKVGDTGPDFTATIRDQDGEPVNLLGSTAAFVMRNRRTRVGKTDAACTLLDAVAGRVAYAWQAADTDTAGHFEAVVRVTMPDGSIFTAPRSGWHPVEIEAAEG